jgi:hypothetical protein
MALLAFLDEKRQQLRTDENVEVYGNFVKQ